MVMRQVALGCVVQLLMATPPALCAQAPDSTLELALRRVVAAQATSDLALTSSRGGDVIAPRSVAITSGPATHLRVRVWRATVWSMSHWPPYLLAAGASEPLRLGGFPAPELRELLSGLRTQVQSASDAQALARDLATLLDPNGAQALVFPATRDSAPESLALVLRWERTRPATWPSDGAEAGADGSYSVRMTALSREDWDQRNLWLPIAYSFELGSDGHVVAWARRVGEPFPHRERQTH